jgi:signal transduction histidine kinase
MRAESAMHASDTPALDLGGRIASARAAADRALLNARVALAESERARLDAEAGHLAAERAQTIALAAQRAAEEACEAAAQGQAVAELAADEAQLAQQHLQNFLALAAHDLQNPITGILGFAQLLQRPKIRSATRTQAVHAILQAAILMSRLIRDLVDAGNAGVGGFGLQPVPTDLVAVVQQVVESQAPMSSHHRILVDAPARLEGRWDADRLGQVLTNQIANAIKYSPDGGEIRIRARSQDDAAIVTVTDEGIGICTDDLPRLFRPFARLADSARFEGTGLGLYISQGIVVAHGGRISAESPGPGLGSTFTIRLPLSGPADDGQLAI